MWSRVDAVPTDADDVRPAVVDDAQQPPPPESILATVSQPHL